MLGSILKSVFGRGDPAACLRAGIAARERGDLEAARRLLDAALRADPRNAEAHYYAGLVASGLARHRDALRHFEQAVELAPHRSECRYQAASAAYLANDLETARQHCEGALELNPDFLQCQQLLSQITLPGPPYLEVLSAIHRLLQPRTYLEIGVYKGQSLMQALPHTRAVGIDPAPKIDCELPASFTVHATTSDRYFADHDVTAELGGLPIDLAFIDGLHHFDYALRDFINIEKHCTPRSTILIHDCYPLNRRTAERETLSGFSSGDVWRLILVLKKYRPDLRLGTIGTRPTGLGVVRGLDPASTVLEQGLERIVAEFMQVDYDVLSAGKPAMLNLVPNDPQALRALLEQPGS